MMRLAGIDVHARPEIVLPILAVALLVLAAVAGRLARRAASRWLTHPPAVSLPIACAIFIGGFLLVPEFGLPGRLGHWVEDALDVSFILACALVVSRVAVSAVTDYAMHNPSLSPALGVARISVRLLVGALAVIMALESLSVPVAPLVTTLGVGSLAIALALQETLANFFAGLYLLADRPVRAGDYIKLHDGEEGFVETIGWRSSRLRTQKNSTVIVPNQKLSQAILTNFHLPTTAVGMSVNVTVAYGADVTAVETCLADTLARAVAEVPEMAGSKPVARLVDLTDAGQIWTCFLEVGNMDAQGVVGHALRKRLIERLGREGLALGVPERRVRAVQDQGQEKGQAQGQDELPREGKKSSEPSETTRNDSLTGGKGAR
jgi:small-conductance mechanosensitive channel